MNWKGRKVLITGGAGFIGSHLVGKLLGLGANVRVADNFYRGRIENIGEYLSRIELLPADLTTLDNCVKATEDVEIVFHLAATVGGIHYINKQNVGGMTPSILMNQNMLEASRITKVEYFQFTSSACVYRQKSNGLNSFKEEDAYPANPATTYGWAKIQGEIACQAYQKDCSIKTSIVRLFNVYGENECLNPDSAHVIPSLIRKAILYPEVDFEIFGKGDQERGFIYVKDCVEGLIRALEKKSDGDPINLGNGNEVISIKGLAERIIDISGKDIQLKHNLSAPSGTYKYSIDDTKMKKELQWEPEISFNEGLKSVYNWAKKEIE